jgi:hypothetical protein
MNVVPAFGISELVLILFMGSGFGVPLGVPPEAPDPVLAAVAPAECLYYSSWAGMGEPDAASKNQTEQLLAEPEVQRFLQEVEQVIERGVRKLGSRGRPDEQLVMQKIPLLAKSLITHGAALFVESVTPGMGGVDVQGALVVSLGDDLPVIQEALQTIRRQFQPGDVQDIDVAGHACWQLQPNPRAPRITIGLHDHYLIVAVGDRSFAGVLERAEQSPPAWLTQAKADVEVPRLSTFSYLNTEAVVKLASNAPPQVQQVLAALGLNTVSRVVSASGLDESGFVSRTRLFSSAPERGLLGLAGTKPLTAADLAGVPADAAFALATRLDLARIFDQGLAMTREIEPQAADQVELQLAQLEQMLGVQLKQDLLQSLGDVWTLHAAPSGGGLLTGWTLAVSLRDKPRLEAAHQKLLLLVQAQLAQMPRERAPRIHASPVDGTTIYSLSVPAEAFALSPCWCLTDSHLVVALLPQAIKSYLAQSAGKESLAGHPAVASLLSAQPAPITLTFQDTRSQFLTFYPWLQLGAQMAVRQLQKEGIEADPATLPSTMAVAPHLLPSISSVQRVSDGFEAVTRGTLPGANVGATAPVMVGLLLPAVQAAREAARRTQSMNNLKQIGLAMHNYHDVYRGLPPAGSVDKDGKPLLSWRVFILPFIEEQPLYEQFRLNEPWDSEHNRKLIERMPAVYRSPNSVAEMGKTVYLGNAGPDGVFVPQKPGEAGAPKGISFAKIRDGLSNTIMAVEASDAAAVIWTKPDDYVPSVEQPLRGVTGMRPGGFLALLCDGSVRFISHTIDPAVLQGLFTANGGEVLSGDY